MASTYPLASSTWDQAEYKALQNVIDSRMFTMGEHVRSFEVEFAKYIGSSFAVMVNSGSSANLLMAAALLYSEKFKLNPGDEILVPAVSWSTSYFPFTQIGLKLRFVDIDIHTLNYDLDKLKDAVTDQTRAILAVNILGNPNDFDKVCEISDHHNLILLEDNCESLGANYNGKKAGSFGVMGTFSTFFSHHISTMEGGLVVTNDQNLYDILVCLRSHGWTRHLPKDNTLVVKSSDHFEESFRFILPGYNLRPLEMSGALGLTQLKKLPGFITARQENANRFCDIFLDQVKFITQREIGQSSWFGFSMIINPDAGYEIKSLRNKLDEFGIEYRPIVAGSFLKNDVIKYLPHTCHDELPVANYIHENSLFIGNHHIPIDDNFFVKLASII